MRPKCVTSPSTAKEQAERNEDKGQICTKQHLLLPKNAPTAATRAVVVVSELVCATLRA